MDEQAGLAQAMGQVQVPEMGTQGRQVEEQLPQSVGQIIEMIMQGADPEELLKQGVPQELIELAMQEIMKQMQPSEAQSGLAGAQVRGEDKYRSM